MITWKTADEVALRQAVLKIGEAKLKERLLQECTTKLDGKTLLEANDSAVVRCAAHRAGFEEAIDALIAVALSRPVPEINSGHQPM